ncbi:MAG: type II secretion system F family protein [Thermoplasmatales archaeon]
MEDNTKKSFLESPLAKALARRFYWISRLLGEKYLKNLRRSLDAADIWIKPEIYGGISIFFSLVAAIVIFVIEVLLLVFVASRDAEIFVAFLIPVSFLVTFYTFSLYPNYKASIRARNIAENLEQAYIFISALANSDVPLIVIFTKLSEQRIFGDISREAEKILALTNIAGLDIYSAISEASKTSPSEEWKNFLHGLISTAESGSRLKQYFEEKVKDYHNRLRLSNKANGDAISIFAEVYVTIGMALPLFLGIILGVMSVISAPASKFSEYVLIALSLIVEPVIIASFIAVVSSVNKEVGIR